MPPSVGGVKEVTDYFKLFDYDINLLIDALEEGRRADELGELWIPQRWRSWRRRLSPA